MADAAEAQEIARVDQALKRLRANLGHPSAKELVRILKHSRASDIAVQRASQLQCSVCVCVCVCVCVPITSGQQRPFLLRFPN